MLVAAIGAVGGWWLVDPFGQPSDPLRAWAGMSQGRRHPVAQRFVADNTHIGMTSGELRQRLGEPGYSWDDGKTLGWYIGDPPGAGWLTMDMDYLEVTVEAGRVTGARICTSRY